MCHQYHVQYGYRSWGGCRCIGAGFPRNFIPDFSWGGPDSPYRTHKFADACETASIVMGRRSQYFTELEKAILYHVYDQTARFRSWEK